MADGENIDDRGDGATTLGFKRHFVLPGLVLSGLELIAIVWPLLTLFGPAIPDRGMLVKIAVPVLVGAQITWWVAVGSWLTPIYRAIQLKRRGQRTPDELAIDSYRAAWRVPRRALLLRTALWIAVAAAHGLHWNHLGRADASRRGPSTSIRPVSTASDQR